MYVLTISSESLWMPVNLMLKNCDEKNETLGNSRVAYTEKLPERTNEQKKEKQKHKRKVSEKFTKRFRKKY